MPVDFKTQRGMEDAALLGAHGGIRTREQAMKAASKFGDVHEVTGKAGILFNDLFCAAARMYGATVCRGCGNLTISHEINSQELCDTCMVEVDIAICALPLWVKDRDLGEVIPALCNAYIRTKNEAQ